MATNTKRRPAKKSTKSRRTQKKRTKKGKVYIAPYKIIILCAAIIALSMGLLVVSTGINQRAWDKQQTFLEEQRKAEELKKEEIRKEEEKRQAEEKAKADKARQEKAKAEKASEEKRQSELAAKKKAEQKQKEEARKAEEKRAAEKKASEKKNSSPTSPAVPPKQTEPVRTPNTETTIPSNPAATTPVTSPVKPAQTKFDFPPAKNGAQLVIVLDDGGQNLSHLQKFLELPFPITIAVLPQIAHSKESAAKVRASGKELMLHQPMQAVNEKVNPGPGAITPDMSEQQIKAMLYRNISELGSIAGFNNHEGSLITADEGKMEIILKYASENGIYFLDSRTNVNTTVPAVASALGLSYYERNGRFLDNVKTRENAISEIRRNLDIANRDGVVIMIGHIWSADFLPAALMEVYPELIEKGYTFKTVSNCRGLKR